MEVNFEQQKWVSGGKIHGDVRRLEIASWGVNKEKPLLTQWLWYFLDDYEMWQTCDFPHAIEEAYVDGNVEFEYTRSDSMFRYKLHFLGKLLNKDKFFFGVVVIILYISTITTFE